MRDDNDRAYEDSVTDALEGREDDWIDCDPETAAELVRLDAVSTFPGTQPEHIPGQLSFERRDELMTEALGIAPGETLRLDIDIPED